MKQLYRSHITHINCIPLETENALGSATERTNHDNKNNHNNCIDLMQQYNIASYWIGLHLEAQTLRAEPLLDSWPLSILNCLCAIDPPVPMPLICLMVTFANQWKSHRLASLQTIRAPNATGDSYTRSFSFTLSLDITSQVARLRSQVAGAVHVRGEVIRCTYCTDTFFNYF